MNNDKILEEILENTKQMKTVIVDKEEEKQQAKAEKLEKRKTAQQRAEAKFVKIGTKLNEAELAKFNLELERLGLNQSQYIKKLLSGELTAYQDFDNQTIIKNLKNDIEVLQELLKQSKEELDKQLNKSFVEKIRELFY